MISPNMCSPMLTSTSCYLSSSVPPFSPQYTVSFFPAVSASKTLHNASFTHDHHYLPSCSTSYLAIVITSVHLSTNVSAAIQRWFASSWADIVSSKHCYCPSILYLPPLNLLWSEIKPLQIHYCQLRKFLMNSKLSLVAFEMDQIGKIRTSTRPSKHEKKDGNFTMKSSRSYEKKISKNMLNLASKAWLSPRRTSRTFSMCWRRHSSSCWQIWTPVSFHLGAYLCYFLFIFAQMRLRPPCISYLGFLETFCYRYHQAVEKQWTLETNLTQNLGLTLCQSTR